MTDYYLKFTDQQQALEVMQSFTYDAEVTGEDGEVTTEKQFSQGGHDYALWVVGDIPDTEGFHVNLRVINPEIDTAALEPYIVHPRNPRCVWA
jgi:hypothetical protein